TYSNIGYNPPEGNVASLTYSLPCGTAGKVVPEDNDDSPEDCDCPCGDDDAGGVAESVSVASLSRAATTSSSSTSSAGKNTRLETNASYARWRTRFGAFRGMGGVSSGSLEIYARGEDDIATLATPAGLEWRHVLGSYLVVPEDGIAANKQFKLCTGGSSTSWLCDGNGSSIYKIGASSKKSLSGKLSGNKVEIYFSDKSVATYSATTGDLISFKTRTGNEFSASQIAENVDVVRNDKGVIAQIWNRWDGLANIENESESGYEIALYLPNQVLSKNSDTGLWSVSGSPFKRFIVAARENGLTITEQDSRSGAPALPVNFWLEGGAWNESSGSGDDEVLTLRSRTDNTDGTWNLTTTKKLAATGAVASCVLEVYETTECGNLLRSRTEGYDTPDARTFSYEYNSAGLRISETRPDGSVYKTDYDAQNRIFTREEPWSGGSRKITYNYYRNSVANDMELSYSRVAYEKSDGTTVMFARTDYSYTETSEYKRVESTTTGHGISEARLQVEETWLGTCTNVYARGRVKMTRDESGGCTHYSYAGTTLHGALYTTTAETRAATNDEPVGIVVNGKSKRVVKYISAEGNVLFEEDFVLDSAGVWQSVSSLEFEYDSANNWTKRTRGNGRVAEQETMCCGLLYEIDEDGVRTDYTYDTARRLVEKMRSPTATMPEQISGYARDARGNIVLETLKLDGPTFSAKSREYDIFGREIVATDELGRTTRTAYSADGLTTTTTLPNGATRTTTKHADGTVFAILGTAQRQVETAIDVVSDGICETRRVAGTSDDAGIISRETRNARGETLRSESANTLGGFVVEESEYNSRGKLVRSVVGGAAPTLFEYDDFGNETKRTLALADTPTTTNSRVSETVKFFETRDDGVYEVTKTTTYSASGTALVSSEARLVSEGATIESKTILTDARGNVSSQWTEFGDACERIAKSQVASATNVATTRTVDGFVVEQTDYAGITKTFAREFRSGDNAGVIFSTTDGRGNTTQVFQNVLGWTTKTLDALGNATTTEYDLGQGRPSVVTDALGNERRFAYDLHGNVVAEFGSGSQPAVFEFGDADNKISQKLFRAGSEVIDGDPRERGDFDETLWVYHEATGLLLAKIYPNGSRTDYAYDARNRLATTTLAREIDAAGTRLQLTRAYDDKTNELVSVTSNDGTVATSYVYNFLGQLLRMSDSSEITISYGYTEFGEVESETRSGLFNKVLTHHYDDFGREIGYSLDGERKTIISFESDTGRVSSLLAETKNFAWNYLAGTSLKSKLVYPNDAVSEWSYEEKRDLLSCVKNTINSAITSQYDYENDALGRRTVVAKSGTMFDGDDRVAVGYNNRSEVVSAVAANDNSYSYAYDFDNIGNRNSATESGTTTAYSANELNQYSDVVVEGDSFVPEYDADGNMIVVKASSGTWDVEHSGENRPTTWTKRETGEKIYMMFDALGRRTEKRVLNASGVRTLRERYVYNGFLCVQILDGDSNNAVIKEFVWDPTESVATRPLAFSHVRESLNLLYNFDGNKNVSEVFYLAEANGIGAHYDYAPFGAVCRTTRATRVTGFDAIEQNPFRFSSEFHDPELDLVYYNYRHYSPTLGRFLSRDPIEEQGGLNLYAFVKNNCVSVVDINGEDYSGTPESTISPCEIGTDGIFEEIMSNPKFKDRVSGLTGESIYNLALREGYTKYESWQMRNSVHEFWRTTSITDSTFVMSVSGTISAPTGSGVNGYVVNVSMKYDTGGIENLSPNFGITNEPGMCSFGLDFDYRMNSSLSVSARVEYQINYEHGSDTSEFFLGVDFRWNF
ncbi:MAG: hypothetical protein LUD52_02780, partial [Opitutae bacterium]|nr:hypothetical protein [Opitutae bacterium]